MVDLDFCCSAVRNTDRRGSSKHQNCAGFLGDAILFRVYRWLVAALGVGLGFGLQEIVANFFSGIIILFEQPVRIGDTVTVGELSGTVSKFRIRATTITDWDNKEIIVPNKMLITERLINWTLTDPITRVIVKVGIAYGSDTAKAHDVMPEVAKSNPMVLDAPEPTVYFLGFGDSALEFEVRVFVRELGHRLPIMHELHMAIDNALRENGFEIPFPQRYIHIRSSVTAENPLAGKAASAPRRREDPDRPRLRSTDDGGGDRTREGAVLADGLDPRHVEKDPEEARHEDDT
jgi:small-conductance mechanosensitive channel